MTTNAFTFDDTQNLNINVAGGNIAAGDYETVAASQTDQVLGSTGATGDYFSGILIVPGTTAAGAV